MGMEEKMGNSGGPPSSNESMSLFKLKYGNLFFLVIGGPLCSQWGEQRAKNCVLEHFKE